jgi:hypothetical protein
MQVPSYHANSIYVTYLNIFLLNDKITKYEEPEQ